MKLSLSSLLAATLLASSVACAPVPFSDDADNVLSTRRKATTFQEEIDARNHKRWRDGYSDFYARTAFEPIRDVVRMNRPERDMSHMTDRQLIDSIIEDRNNDIDNEDIEDDSSDNISASDTAVRMQQDLPQESRIWTSEAEKAITEAAGRVKMEFRRTAGSITNRIDSIRVSLLRASLLVD